MLESRLHVDGRLEGDVRSQSDISIGTTGEIEGNVVARNIVISGLMRGTVDCGRLEVMPSGRLHGDVVSDAFIIDPGGEFVGANTRRSEVPRVALDYLEPEIVDPTDAPSGAGTATTRPIADVGE